MKYHKMHGSWGLNGLRMLYRASLFQSDTHGSPRTIPDWPDPIGGGTSLADACAIGGVRPGQRKGMCLDGPRASLISVTGYGVQFLGRLLTQGWL